MTAVTTFESLYHKSPLDTLVRQSSRAPQADTQDKLQPASESTVTRHGRLQDMRHNPTSPLLHTTFRTSTSTGTSSFMDMRYDETTTSIQNGQRPNSSWSGDDASVYSRMSGSSTIRGDDRQSWASHGSDATVQMDASTQPARGTWRSSSNEVDPFSFRQYESPVRDIPMVVVSSPTASVANSSFHDSPDSNRSIAPRPSVTQYSISNFSRPLRYAPVQDAQRKQDALERNRTPQQPDSQQHLHQEFSPQNDQGSVHSYHWQQDNHYNASSHSVSPPMISDPPGSYMSNPGNFRSPADKPQPTASSPVPSGIARSTSPIAFPDPLSQPIRLPNSPPSPRPMSRASLYSAYSFYQLDDGSRTPSPSSPNYHGLDSSDRNFVSTSSTKPLSDPHSRSRASPSPVQSSPVQSSPSVPTPDEFLFLGIQHHEANRLAESAVCFERAATIDGGCGTGMLMWGLSLRHAWGTPKDEKAAFRWLRRAAEAAVGDLEAARNGQDQKAVKVRCLVTLSLTVDADDVCRRNWFWPFMRWDSVSSMGGVWGKIRRWL